MRTPAQAVWISGVGGRTRRRCAMIAIYVAVVLVGVVFGAISLLSQEAES
jgi:hypothetical protein